MDFKEQIEKMATKMKEHVRSKMKELAIESGNQRIQDHECLMELTERLEMHITSEE